MRPSPFPIPQRSKVHIIVSLKNAQTSTLSSKTVRLPSSTVTVTVLSFSQWFCFVVVDT